MSRNTKREQTNYRTNDIPELKNTGTHYILEPTTGTHYIPEAVKTGTQDIIEMTKTLGSYDSGFALIWKDVKSYEPAQEWHGFLFCQLNDVMGSGFYRL